MILNNTPVEKVYLDDRTKVLVKREDLCTRPPAPPFSKMRGVMVHLANLKRIGIETVGYVETSISMAGWGVAWACKELGLKAVIFDPQYKEGNELPLHTLHRQKWRENGVNHIRPIKAGMARVNWNIARKIMAAEYPNSVLLPLGVPFEETVTETAKEAEQTIRTYKPRSIVIAVGSGTIAAGVWKGVKESGMEIHVHGVACRNGDMKRKLKSIFDKSKIFFPIRNGATFTLHNPEWEYTQPSLFPQPFPCHPYYDLKAWEWLVYNTSKLPQPLMFWNIGAMAE